MLSIDEIKKLIDDDKVSEKKNRARIGQNYYEGKHDIRNYKIFQYTKDGLIKENKYATNIKISHPFFTELVDQQVQYMLSGEGFAYSDNKELQKELDNYFGNDFLAELNDCLQCVCVNGFGYMYAYMGEDGRIHFENADAMGVVEVRAKDTNDNCDYIIYHYTERIAKLNKKIRHIEVWDKEQTYYYVQEDNGKIILDNDKELNPRPHILYREGDDLFYNSLGFIPFFRLDNNRKQISNLNPIKDIIDDYDLMSCALSNNLQDFNEALYVVKGFKGDSIDELVENVQATKHIAVSSDGGVEVHTIDIPYEARKVKIDQDEKDIYKFGMGFDSTKVGDGNITNIVIKSRYALLDMKCNKLEARLKKFLKKLSRVVVDEINNNNETGYSENEVYFKFERCIMTNALDNEQQKLVEAQTKQTAVNTLITAATELGKEAVIEKICEVLDIDYEEIKDKIPNDLEDFEERLDNEETERI